jgi:hypothetical protein
MFGRKAKCLCCSRRCVDISTIRWYTRYCYRVNAVGEHAEQRTRRRLRRLRIMAVKKIIFRKIVFEFKDRSRATATER